MRSLRTKILTIVLAFLALIGTGFIFYSMITTVNYKRLRLEGIEKTVEFETEKVNKTITEMEQSAIYLALCGSLFYQSQSYDTGEIPMLEYLRNYPEAVGGGFWFVPYAYNSNTLRAFIYAYFDKTNNEFVIDYSADYDYLSMDWYLEILDSVTQPYKAVWTKPYTDDSSYSLMTTAGAGIYDINGTLLGISNIDWEINKVVAELSAIKPTENSFILLCVPEKDYIISSTNNGSLAGASIKSSLNWDINADSFTLDGVNYYRFGMNMNNGWLLSIQIPEKEIFAEVERQNNHFSVLIALSSFFMLCVAYYLVSKQINAPIKQLTTEVSQLALGNLDINIDVNSDDELGLLAQTFNKMTTDLKKSIEENIRERAEKERIKTELSVATEMQASMLPCVFPPFPERSEFDLYASMRPAKEVGGDFYDFFLVDKNTLAVLIADVSGKGVPAALFMVIAKTLIKNSARSGKTPGEVFESVNNMLCENNETNMFVTAFMGFFDIPNNKFVYSNAGHNPPLVKKSGSDYEFLKTKPNTILAWMKDTHYREEELILPPGSMLYLYTDGVTEALNANMDMFSEKKLLEALNKNKDLPPLELLHAIKAEVDSFAAGAEQADDITMLALQVNII